MLSRAGGLLPPAGPARVLVLSGFSGAIGTGLFLAGSMLFFVRGVGLTPHQVAVALGIAGAAGLVASVPVGALADRIGPRGTLVALHLWRAVAYSLYLTVHSFPAFLVVVCATTMADKAASPVNQALVGLLFDGRERLRTMAFLRAAQNIGLSAGAMLASLSLSAGTRSAYDLLALGNGASYVLMAVLVWRLRTPATHDVAAAGGAPATATVDHHDEPGSAGVIRHRRPSWLPFTRLSLANGALGLHDTVLFVGLPLWIDQYTDAPTAVVGVLLTINTIVTALTQVWWTRLAGTLTTAIRGMVATGLLLAVASLAIGLAGAGTGTALCLLLLIGGVLLLTAGENLHAACGWALSFELSPRRRRGRYLAAFNAGLSVRDLLGPALITALPIGFGFWGWAGLAAGFLFAGPAAGQAALTVRHRAPHRYREKPHAPSAGSGGQHAVREATPAATARPRRPVAPALAGAAAPAHHRGRP